MRFHFNLFYFKLSLWLIPSSVTSHMLYAFMYMFYEFRFFSVSSSTVVAERILSCPSIFIWFSPNISCTMQISLTLTTLFWKPLACLNATIIFPTNKGLTQNRREIALIQYPTISPEFSSQMYIQSSDSMPYSELIEELNGVLFVCSTLPLFFV